MKHEVHPERPEEEEVGEEPPELVLSEDQMAVVVHAERGDELQRASRGGEERQREVRPRHDRHLAVPLLQRHRHRARISRPRVDRSIPKFIFSTNEANDTRR